MSELTTRSKTVGRPRKPCNWTAATLKEAAKGYFEKCDARYKFERIAATYFEPRELTDENGESYMGVSLDRPEEQRLAAEEYIAHLAQKGVPKPSWWKEFLQKIRMWWSNTRFGSELHMTDSQIETLLARAARKVRNKSTAKGNLDVGGVRFAVDGELKQQNLDNRKKSQKVISALQKIANGSEEETVLGLRNDLEQYGGTNDITFYWGNEKKGIYHIAYRRGVNTLLRVIDAVAYGKILRFVKGNKTVVLEKDGFEAVLALTEYGQQKSWLLSGWKVDKPDANGEVGTQSAATQPEPTFSRQELGAGLINNISQIFENASGDLSDGAEKSDGADKLRFSLADYDEQTQDDIIAILRPFVRQNIDMEPERYIAYLKEKNVNIPDEDAAVFFRLAVIENDKAARERIKRARDQWLFENFPIFGEVAEFVGGADFKIKPAGHEGEEFTGSFISPEYIKYSLKRPQGKNESDKSYKKYLANRKEKLANAEGMAIDEISEHLSRKLGQDEHSVREQILDFFRHLKKKDLDAASVKDYLEDLKTQVEEFFDLTPIAHRIWKNDRDQFLKSIKESSISNKQI